MRDTIVLPESEITFIPAPELGAWDDLIAKWEAAAKALPTVSSDDWADTLGLLDYREGLILSDSLLDIVPLEPCEVYGTTLAKRDEARPAPFKLPVELTDILRAAGDNLSTSKWIAARAIVAYLDDLPEQKRNAYRADVIKAAAQVLQQEEATIREWVHVAEVMPEGIEDHAHYAGWGFSLFARAARMGETDLAIAVLELARQRQTKYGPGEPPPCWSVNQIVAEQKERLRGATEAELERLRTEAREHRLRFHARVMQSALLERLIVIIPDGTELTAGDDVLIIKQRSQGE